MISSILKKNKPISLDIQEPELAKEKKEEFIKFKNQLEIITSIKEGDKLSKLTDYYIDVGG